MYHRAGEAENHHAGMHEKRRRCRRAVARRRVDEEFSGGRNSGIGKSGERSSSVG
jgi:hypothetical protein